MWNILLLGLLGASVASGSFLIQNREDSIDNNEFDDEWWKTALIYQIYPRSFKDTNGDGIGDIPGIIEKLDYIKELQVTAIWLSPVFKSPQVDQGYDVSDYYIVDEIFGTNKDLLELIEKAHKLGIKVILDYVPNHTSIEHEWFQKSILQDDHYDDWYIWKNGTEDKNGTMIPPNNWISCFGDSAWTWEAERKSFYLHQFAPAQPDLNYRNSDVSKAMKEVLTYWMDQGADGFRMDAVTHLLEDAEFKNEPLSGTQDKGPSDYKYLKHVYTKDLDETYDVIYQWRKHLDDYSRNKKYSRIMITETYTDTEEEAIRFYGASNKSADGAHFTFNFNLITDIKMNFTVNDIIAASNKWLSMIPNRYVSNWVLGNHDQSRLASRLGLENVDAFNMLAAILPGVQVTYMGEEMGMENGNVTCDEGWDPQAIKHNCSNYNQKSRDFERTPFHWDNTTNAGFSNATKTWLPVSKKYLANNIAAQNATGVKSHFKIYKSLTEFRKNFKNVSYDSISFLKLSDNVLQIIRATDKGTYTFVFNAGNKTENVTLYKTEANQFTVLVSSINSSFSRNDLFSNYEILEPHESIILYLNSTTNSSGINVRTEFAWNVCTTISLFLFLLNTGIY